MSDFHFRLGIVVECICYTTLLLLEYLLIFLLFDPEVLQTDDTGNIMTNDLG